MPTPQREPLRRMTRAERAVLRRIVNGSSERVDQVRRATALLAVAEGSAFIHAAWQAGLHSGTTVADLVGRFNRHGLAALRIATGRGRKPTYVASARARIVRYGPADAQSTCRRDGDMVAEHLAADLAPRRLSQGWHEHHSACAARRRQLVPADAHVVSDGYGAAQAQSRRGHRGRPADRSKKGLIELAYRVAESVGIPVWCQDEAGPCQAIPQPGQS
jgi:hypothetical protein